MSVEAIGYTLSTLLSTLYVVLIHFRSNWIRSFSNDRRWKQAFALFGKIFTRKRSVSPAVLFHHRSSRIVRYVYPGSTKFEPGALHDVTIFLQRQPSKRYQTRPPTLQKRKLVVPGLRYPGSSF